MGRVIGAVGSGWLLVELREFGRDDQAAIDAFVDLENACLPDAPVGPPEHGVPAADDDDARLGRRGRPVLPRVPGRERATRGIREPSTPRTTTTPISPGSASRCIPSTGGAVMAKPSSSRPTTSAARWGGPRGLRRLGPRAHAPLRRRYRLRRRSPSPSSAVSTSASSSRASATGCTPRRSRTPPTTELERIDGASPEELLGDLAEATAAINDAPLDDLEIEDEVFIAERVRAYERAQIDSGFRFCRIIARHRATGEIGGLTVADRGLAEPCLGNQHDTSVVRAHRGHRLGLLLKADMMRWLADAEPELEQLDTWNMESNDAHDRGQRAAGLSGDGPRDAVPTTPLGWGSGNRRRRRPAP